MLDSITKFKAMAWYGPDMGMKLKDIAEAAEEDEAIADDLLIKEGEYQSLRNAFKSWGINDNESITLIEAAWWDEVTNSWYEFAEVDCRRAIESIEVIRSEQ